MCIFGQLMFRKKTTYTDKALVAGIRAGGHAQEQCVRHLFDQYRGLIRQAQRKHRLSAEEANDAYTDAIIGLRKQIVNGKFRGESKISTYLYQIYQYKCIDKIRSKTAGKIDAVDQFPNISDDSSDIFAHLSIKEDFARVNQLMEKLGGKCKQILLDVLFYQYKLEEVAKRAGLPSAQHASDRKYKCLQKLRKMIPAHARA